MTLGQHRLTIPSTPEYSVGQPRLMIREAEAILDSTVGLEKWEALS
jgi:hypothetical protein